MNQEAANIIKDVCRELSVQVDDVMSRSRERHIVEARFLCVHFILKKLTPVISKKTIGLWFKCKEKGAHSFVIYASTQTEVLSVTNKEFSVKYQLVAPLFDPLTHIFNNVPQY